MKMTYAEQLKHPKWQKRRLEILNRARFECENCGDKDNTLHVHHRIYRKSAMAWDYSDEELAALCEACHEAETLARAELAEWLAFFDVVDIQALTGYAKAIYVNKAWDFTEYRQKRIRVGSCEEAEALGTALGLDVVESMHMLARKEPFSTAELHTIEIACQKLRRGVPPRALSVDELVELAEVHPVPETEL